MGATLVAAPIKPPEVDYSDPKDFDRKWDDYTGTLAELARKQHEGDLVGELVRWQRADGYATYMVLSESPLRLVHIDMLDGYTVEPSLLRGLTLAEVRRMVEWERSWRRMANEPNEQFYTADRIGQIVHYVDGSAQFVRCEVVAADTIDNALRGESKAIGGVALKPIALVGEIGRRQEADGRWVHGWNEFDLPRRMPDGSLRTSYHVDQVLEGTLMQPNASNIYEYDGFDRKRVAIDPAGLEPIPLDLPPLTAQEERIATLAKALNRIRETVAENPPEIAGENGYLHIFTQVTDIIIEARTGRSITNG